MIPAVKQELKLLCADRLEWEWALVEPDGFAAVQLETPQKIISDTAVTALKAKRTWLDAFAFNYGKDRKRLHRSIAHELGHIRLNTNDEDRANDEENRILKAAAAGRCP